MIHHLTRATRHLLLLLLVASAIGSIVIRILLTAVDDYKTEFEQQFYQLTHIQMQIGSLSAGTRGVNPEIIFRDINILSKDKAGKPAVQLKEVRVGIDVLELLFSQDLLASSWLALVGLKITVIRQEDGQFSIKGLNDNNEQPLWLARGGKYEILQSEISLQDKKNQNDNILFKHFDLLITNNFDRHEIHLLTDLPEQYGDSLSISAIIDGNLLTADNLSGDLYLEGNNIDFAAVDSEYLPFSFAFIHGQGGFKLWSKWRDSRPYQVAGHINGEAIEIERGNNSKLALARLDSDLTWSSRQDGWQFSVQDLRVEVEQQQWPAANFSLSVFGDKRISVLIKQVDLQEVSYFAPFFLDTDQQAKLPKEFKMAGVLQDFSIYTTEDLQQFALNGSFSDITINSAADTLPQLQGVSGQVHGSQKQGSLVFDSKSGSLFFPSLFRSAIDFQQIAGAVNWQKSQQGWHLSSDYFVVNNADFKTYSRFDVQIPETDQPVFMALKTVFKGTNEAPRVASYLPTQIMDSEVVHWLDHAFVKGRIQNGNLLLSGYLNEFPFSHGQGKFEVMFDVERGILNYHQDWPLLENLNAEVRFFADNLQINVRHAHSQQLTVKQAVVDIPKLSQADRIVVDGVINGGITEGVLFMQKTPLHTTVDGVLATANFQGKTQVDLKLKIPLTDILEAKVDGVVHVGNSRMVMKSPALTIEQLHGDLYFTEQGVFCKRMDGKTLGFPVQARIKTELGVIRIRVNGKSNMRNVQQQFSFLQNNFIQGGFSYRAAIDLPLGENKAATLKLDTNLQGVKVLLPEELAKSRKQKKSLQLSMQLSEKDILPLWLNYNNQLKIALQINKQTETLLSGHIVYGSGQAVAGLKNSLKLTVRQPNLDIAAWLDFIAGDVDKLTGKLPELNEVHVSLGELRWGSQQFGELEFAVKRENQYWQGSLFSPVAQGNIRIPVDFLNNKIHLQMTRLDLSRLNALDFPVNSVIDSNKKLPLIDIFSDQVVWQDIDLGRLELKTKRFSDGIRFSKIKLTGGGIDIDMTADWLQTKTGYITELKGRLTSNDFGRFLGKLGYNDDLLDTKATIDFNGSWSATPYQFSLAELTGQVQVRLEDGRISSIEPGFGRLLGLIAMKQWVKRFTLDFSDIYKKGLAFNSITGKFSINAGMALTDDLVIDAIPARISITGLADLMKKTLDYRVLVVPKSSAAVPIAGTIVGGIAAAITQVFTDDYKEGYFFGSEYKVKGSWGDAKIIPLHERDGLLKKTWQDLTDFPWLQSGAN